jgi:hypothetical protein
MSVLMVSGPARHDTVGRSAMSAHLAANAHRLVGQSAPIGKSFRAGSVAKGVNNRQASGASGLRKIAVPCAIGPAALVQPDRATAASQTSSIAIKR